MGMERCNPGPELIGGRQRTVQFMDSTSGPAEKMCSVRSMTSNDRHGR